jgi:hypothetical protein
MKTLSSSNATTGHSSNCILHMMEACDLLNREEILASEEDMFLTIGVFGDCSDFSKSMVFSKELLGRLSELKLTLEVNTYG